MWCFVLQVLQLSFRGCQTWDYVYPDWVHPTRYTGISGGQLITVSTLFLWWRHQRKHFPRHWPFVRGIHRSPVNSPHKSEWRGSLMFSLISAWINGLVNNAEVGDLRRHRAHYDVTLMYTQFRWSDMPWRSCDVAVMKWWNIKIHWYLHVISKQFIMSSPVVKKEQRDAVVCTCYLIKYVLAHKGFWIWI